MDTTHRGAVEDALPETDRPAAADEAARAGPDSADERSIAVIIPAYNEEETIGEVVEAARPYAEDVIVVDDDSDDRTEAIAREHADGVVAHPTNLGVGAALHTGYCVALRGDYDVLVQLDADGQHDPERIPELLAAMDEEDAGVVVGSRWLNESHRDYSLLRRIGIRFFTMEANLLGGTDVTDVTSGYRAYDMSLVEELGRPENRHWALEQTLEIARKDETIAEVSVPMPPEVGGSQFDVETYLRYPARMLFTTLKVVLFR